MSGLRRGNWTRQEPQTGNERARKTGTSRIQALTILFVALLGGVVSGAKPSGDQTEGDTGHGPLAQEQVGSQVQSVPTWRVDPDPEVSIGAAEGPEEYLLHAVWDGTVLSDGTIVVVMYFRRFFQIRYFSNVGDHIVSVGRYGEGPFEVGGAGRGLFGRLPGDSILVAGLDYRFSVFGPKGERGRTGRTVPRNPFGPGRIMPLGVLDDHTFGFTGERNPGESGSDGGSKDGEHAFFIHDSEFEQTESVGVVRLTYRTSLGENGLFLKDPFRPTIQWSVGAGGMWWGRTDEPRIEGQVLGKGAASFGFRRHGIPRRVTRSDRDRWKEYDLGTARNPESERSIRRHHLGLDFPEFFPVFQVLQADEAGYVWVLRYEPPWSEEPYVWDVFESRGVRIAEVVVPFHVFGSQLRGHKPQNPVLEIGEDYVLILNRDEFGVERIQKLRILR